MRPGNLIACARLVLLAIPFVMLACSSDPPLREDPPAAPDENDSSFQVERVRDWYLVGNDLTPGDDTLQLRVSAPAGIEVVDAWIGDHAGVRLERINNGFELTADIADLVAGEHDLLLAADGKATAFARVQFRRSHPLYVLVSTDWDFSDPSQQALDWQDVLHDEHPSARITHFIGPYTFTDPAMTDQRETQLVDWLKAQRDDHDDEIGLHIHPYCHFVEYAGLTCNTDESLARDIDLTGYTVTCESYGDTNFRTLLETADELFMERGLGKPVTFRAGAWSATIDTLRALAATGYVADTSAANWARLEEWQGSLGASLYEWNMQHWSSIGDTSQPYYPSEDDVQSGDGATLSILEVPDNGIMVDYVSVQEMREIFDANWDGSALEEPVSYMMGLHPSSQLSTEEKSRTDGLLDYTDTFLAEDDHGPVVYAVLKDMPLVWKRQ